MDNIHNYRQVLRHVVRPEESSERKESPRVHLLDYEALVLKRALAEFAGYYARDETEERIALGWVEYIDMCIHEERSKSFYLYAHTDKATTVFYAAIGKCDSLLPIDVLDRIVDKAFNGGVEA